MVQGVVLAAMQHGVEKQIMIRKQLRTLPVVPSFGAPCFPWNNDVNCRNRQSKSKGNTLFPVFMTVVWTLDRLIRLINNHTIERLISVAISRYWTLHFFLFIRLGKRTPFILSLCLFRTILLSVPIYRHPIS